jgi:microcystin-dependent protein
MPVHTHTVTGTAAAIAADRSNVPQATSHIGPFGQIQTGTTKAPSGIAAFSPNPPVPDTVLNPATISTAGAGSPLGHENRQPYLATNFCICIDGMYPIRP